MTKHRLIKLAYEARKEFIDNHVYESNDLCGYCAKASRYLWGYLKNHGLNPKIAYNVNHCFIVIEDYILDITASQFKTYANRDVVCVKKGSDNTKGFWSIDMLFEYPEELIYKQIEDDWSTEQIFFEDEDMDEYMGYNDDF